MTPRRAPKTAPSEAAWRSLSEAYLSHHFGCPLCISAGRGEQYGPRCPTGAPLWAAYQQASA